MGHLKQSQAVYKETDWGFLKPETCLLEQNLSQLVFKISSAIFC